VRAPAKPPSAFRVAAWAINKVWDTLTLYRDLKAAFDYGKWQLEALDAQMHHDADEYRRDVEGTEFSK
jgi:hypothetical protein